MKMETIESIAGGLVILLAVWMGWKMGKASQSWGSRANDVRTSQPGKSPHPTVSAPQYTPPPKEPRSPHVVSENELYYKETDEKPKEYW